MKKKMKMENSGRNRSLKSRRKVDIKYDISYRNTSKMHQSEINSNSLSHACKHLHRGNCSITAKIAEYRRYSINYEKTTIKYKIFVGAVHKL